MNQSLVPCTPFNRLSIVTLTVGVLLFGPAGSVADVPVVQTFENPAASDQDDMCLWLHPDDAALSLVIGSDKYADKVFVYDLSGNLLQTIASGKPGNIDVRYGIPLDGDCVDLVAFNVRSEYSIRVYRVDPVSRTLIRVDDGSIDTGSNYGFTLYKHQNGDLYAVTGSKSGPLKQWLLADNTNGQITGTDTGWRFQTGTVEGMVGDDDSGYLFLSEEQAGIWKINALDDSDRTLMAAVGDGNDLYSDVEGITIYYAAEGDGYIIASSQGASRFTVFQRQSPHASLGTFELDGVGATDGIDVYNLPLNGTFDQGIFLAHNGHSPTSMASARWQDIVASLPALQTDTNHQALRHCGITSSLPRHGNLPTIRLHPNNPNPFNPSTHIRYELSRSGFVQLRIYDIGGRLIRTLVEARRDAGFHDVLWDGLHDNGRHVGSVVYFCNLSTGEDSANRSMTLTK